MATFGVGETIALIGTVVSVAATAAGTVYGMESSSAQANLSAETEMMNSMMNQKTANMNAQLAEQEANYEESQARLAAQRDLGRMRSGQAKSGFDLTDTADDVILDSAQEAAKDLLAIRYKGQLNAAQARLQGSEAAGKGAAQAAQIRAQGKYNAGSTLIGGISSGVSSAISGAGSVAGSMLSRSQTRDLLAAQRIA